MKIPALLAVLALGTSSLLVSAPSAVADDTTPVTFPTTTSFNPDAVSYTLTVDDTGAGGTLFAYEGDSDATRVSLPSSGDVTWTFASSTTNSSTTISVERCVDADPCTVLQTSPVLRLVHQVTATVHGGGVQQVTTTRQVVRLDVTPDAGLDVTADWSLLSGGTTISSGSGPVALEAGSTGRLPVTIPASQQVDTTVRLRATLHGSGPDYGQIEGSVEGTFRYVAGFTARATVRTPVFYPVHDGYRDQGLLHVDFSQAPATQTLRVRDAAGRTVGSPRLDRDGDASWSGRAKGNGDILPAGVYQLVVQATDRAGDHVTVTTPIRLSLQRVEWRTRSFDVDPTASQVDTYVGACSTLKKLEGGGIGLYSQTRCQRAKGSAVVSLNGLYLPTALTPQGYRNLRVVVDGGKAAGQSDAYLVLTYRSVKGKDQHRVQLSGSKGHHPGARVKELRTYLQTDDQSRPYVLWQVGLSEGSRYDVTGFRVQVQYQALSKV